MCHWWDASRRAARSSPSSRSMTSSRCPGNWLARGELIMLRVVGDSMINAAIADGDWVVVRPGTDVENGDIVAATIDGVEVEGTVKTFKRADGHVWLMPHNPAYAPILGDDATIVGKVVAACAGSEALEGRGLLGALRAPSPLASDAMLARGARRLILLAAAWQLSPRPAVLARGGDPPDPNSPEPPCARYHSVDSCWSRPAQNHIYCRTAPAETPGRYSPRIRSTVQRPVHPQCGLPGGLGGRAARLPELSPPRMLPLPNARWSRGVRPGRPGGRRRRLR